MLKKVDEFILSLDNLLLTNVNSDDRKLHMESSLNKIREKILNHPCAIISAYRDKFGVCGEGQEIPRKTNNKNHRVLLNKLKTLGYETTQTVSRYKENGKFISEQSVFVCDRKGVGKLKSTVLDLGAQLNQESVIYTNVNKKLIFFEGLTDCESAYPKRGEVKYTSFDEISWGKHGDIYTEIGGRPFFYTFSEENYLPISEEYVNPIGVGSWSQYNKKYDSELFDYYESLKNQHTELIK